MSRTLLLGISSVMCWTMVPEFAQAQTFLGKNESAWVAELEKGNTAARRGAAFALGKLGAPSAVAVLQKHLRNDSDEWVREASACALGEIVGRVKAARDDRLLNVLAETMRTDQKGVTKEKPDGSPFVRRAAAYAIGCMGVDAHMALTQLREVVADKKSPPVVRQNAAWALGKLGPRAIDDLKKVLDDDDSLVKRDAALSMEKWVPEDIRPALAELARLCKKDRDPASAKSAEVRRANSEVRRAALLVLIKAVAPGDDQYINDIRTALEDTEEEEDIHNLAALTLASIGGKDAAVAVPQLSKALTQKGDLELRRQAAALLRNIGPEAKSAKFALIDALGDADPELRKYAAVALGGIGEDAREAYLPLLNMLENTSERDEARIKAAFALKRMGNFPTSVEALPRLLTILGSPKQPVGVRARVVWVLRVHILELRTQPEAIPPFIQVLKEGKTLENKMLRYDCAATLGLIQQADVDPLALETLHEFLKDNTISLFAGVDSKVQGKGPEGVQGKAVVKDHGKDDGRVVAAQALEFIGAERVSRHEGIVAELHKLANDQKTFDDLRERCEGLLQKIEKK